jgi:spermidine/putrescine transport system ATP-binding protein
MPDPSPARDADAIVLEDVSKAYGPDVIAVDVVSFAVREGEFFSILGPSGCGKTTTLRMIAGLEQPSTGRILLRSDDVTGTPPARRNVNMVFQAYALFPHMTVFENVAFGLRVRKVRGSELHDRVGEALRTVRLEGMERRRPGELSGGQQQRVALARALVNRPAALLLDEPLGALDLKLRKEMQLELKAIQEASATTFVYVTHDQEEALTMSDRIAVMNEGAVEQIATPRALYEHPATPFVAGFIGTSNLVELRCDRVEGGIATMQLGESERILAPLEQAPAGDSVQITVRPEKIKIAADRDDHVGSRIRGRVTDIVYLGSLTELIVELPTSERLTVHCLNDATIADAAVGDEVVLEWATEHSFVVDSGKPAGAEPPAETGPRGLPTK